MPSTRARVWPAAGLAGCLTGPALVYGVMGAGWLREDWHFAADHARGEPFDSGFGTFRPVAWIVHGLVFFLPPWAVLAVSTAATVTAAVLFWRVVARWFAEETALRAALVWAALPIHTAMNWWASGLYITIAAALALQSLRDDRPRGALWVVAAGLCYESTVVPVLVVAVIRRQRWHGAAALATLVWWYSHRPDLYRDLLEWLDADDVARGTFGFGVSAVLGAVVVVLLLVTRRRIVAVGLVVAVVGTAPFALQGWDIAYEGVTDRATATAAFGVAVAVAGALPRRWVAPVVAGLLVLTCVRAVEYGRAVDETYEAIRCDRTPTPAGYGGVDGITTWNAVDVVEASC